LHNEELHFLYSSPDTIRTIKSMRKRWAGNVELMEKRNVAETLYIRLFQDTLQNLLIILNEQ
jgi:hypothetical protein